jgi:hypothetical protein
MAKRHDDHDTPKIGNTKRIYVRSSGDIPGVTSQSLKLEIIGSSKRAFPFNIKFLVCIEVKVISPLEEFSTDRMISTPKETIFRMTMFKKKIRIVPILFIHQPSIPPPIPRPIIPSLTISAREFVIDRILRILVPSTRHGRFKWISERFQRVAVPIRQEIKPSQHRHGTVMSHDVFFRSGGDVFRSDETVEVFGNIMQLAAIARREKFIEFIGGSDHGPSVCLVACH